MPYRTHTNLLAYFTGQLYIVDKIYKRFHKLLSQMLNCENVKVCYVARMMTRDCSSIISRNLQCIAHRYDFNFYDIHQKFDFIGSCFKLNFDCDNYRVFKQIQELRMADLNIRTEEFLATEDIDFIISFLCCD